MSLRKKLKAFIRPIKYKLLYGFVLGVIKVSNAIPRRMWLRLCGVLGNMLYFLAPPIRRQVRENLTNAYAHTKSRREIEQLARQVVVMLVKNGGVVLREFSISSQSFNHYSVVRGQHHAENAYRKKRGVIFLTAHLGPFECIAHDLSIRGYHPYIIGTPLKHPLLNGLVNNNRTRFGAVAIERGKETYRVIKNVMAGGTMAILIDQDTDVKSVFVDFFGIPCATPVGAAAIAMKTGAAVVPVFSHLNKNGEHEIDYYPEVNLIDTGNESADIVTNTQRLTTIIENEIRKFPEQWVWMHRRWKTVKLANS